MDIIELNKTKQFEVQLIIDLGKSYGKYINDIVMSLNKDEMVSYDAAITALVKLREDTATLAQGLTMPIEQLLLKSHELYQTYSDISANIAALHRVAMNPNYSRMAMYNFSGTTLNTIVINRNQLIETIERYSEINIDTDTKILKELIIRARVQEHLKQVLLFLMGSEHSTNRYIIELVRMAVKYTAGADRVKLLNIVEQEKDKTLKSSRQRLDYPGVQGLIVRCGLVPVTESVSFVDLLKLIDGVQIHDTLSVDKRGDYAEMLDKIGGSRKERTVRSAIKTTKTQSKYVKSRPQTTINTAATSMFTTANCTAECFEHLAKSNDLCVVLIDKCSNNPIEFNINGLISTEYVEKYDLRTRPGACVDDKVLKRYNTVSEMTAARTEPAKLQSWGQGAAALVIETINGDKYRILCNSMNHYFTPMSVIAPYMAGLNNRLIKYHLLHENDILAKCFDTKARDILANYQKSTVQFPIETARRDLSEKLMESFTERVTTVLPKNLQEFKELVDKDQINSIMMGVFLKFLPVSQNPEYAITYIVRFEDIIRLFNKEIDVHMRNIKITDLTFRERSPNDLRKFLIDTFGDVVRRSIDEMRKTKKFDDIETSLKEFYMEQKNI